MTAFVKKPGILSHIPRHGHAVIEASAGTGKTYTIEHIVVDLVIHGKVPLENILVVTFTEKATAELRQRLRAKLESLLQAPGSPQPFEAEPCWTLDEPARVRLARALASFDQATIATLHAFCQRVLTEQAFFHSRLLQQSQVDEKRAFREAFLEALRHDLARAEQTEPYLSSWLEAGRSVEALEALLADCHFSRCRLTPTFSTDALEQALLDFGRASTDLADLERWAHQSGVHASTKQALLSRLRKLGDSAQVSLAEPNPSCRFLGELDRLGRQAGTSQGPFAYLRETLPRLAARGPLPAVLVAWERLDRAAVPLPAAIAQQLLPPVLQRLGDRKRNQGLFDFGDMLSLVAESLTGAGKAPLVHSLRARYRCALIDEFQDTDDLQWTIFREIFFASSGENPLYVIGDPKQAIYGFRGADVHTYLLARREIVQSGGALIPLSHNYRATPRLIEAQNEILDQRAGTPFFSGAIEYDHPVSPPPEAEGKEAEDPPIRLVSLAGGQEKPFVAKRLLATYIARTIAQLIAKEAVFARDVMVLTRTVREGNEVGAALREACLPHAYFKQEGLFQTEEAGHIRDLLRALIDGSRSARLRAWMTPFFGLSLAQAAASAEAAPILLARLIDWKTLAEAEQYDLLFDRILEESGIIRRALFQGETERQITNYRHLFEILLEQTSRHRPSLAELLVRLESYIQGAESPAQENPNVQRLESERDAVQIMTLHKAKGLEAEVVFIYVGLAGTRPPGEVFPYHEGDRRLAFVGRITDAPRSIRDRIDLEEEEEAQRLFYVGLTRAKRRLYLPYVPQPGKVEGGYRCLHDRLTDIASKLPGSPRLQRLFAMEAIPSEPVSARAEGPAPSLDWHPDMEQLAAPDRDEEHAALARRHAGAHVTSYSRIKEESRPDGGWTEPPPPQGPAAATELPSGTASGLLLHELLEHVPLSTFGGRPSFEAWRSRTDVKELFGAMLSRHGYPQAHEAEAQRLVYRAFRAPIRLGESLLPAGLAASERALREMEFVYPVGAPAPGAEPRHRAPAFLRGFIDLLFEHQGRTYLVDWKSDALATWEAAAVESHAMEQYGLQARVYALALIKMLGIASARHHVERFGGLLFCFLRGMREEGRGTEGIVFCQPTFEQARQWEHELAKTARHETGARG